MLPQSHMAAYAWQEPWGLRRPCASWPCPAGITDHCWSSWLALSLALDLYLVFFFYIAAGRKYLPYYLSLCCITVHAKDRAAYSLCVQAVYNGNNEGFLLWII